MYVVEIGLVKVFKALIRLSVPLLMSMSKPDQGKGLVGRVFVSE